MPDLAELLGLLRFGQGNPFTPQTGKRIWFVTLLSRHSKLQRGGSKLQGSDNRAIDAEKIRLIASLKNLEVSSNHLLIDRFAIMALIVYEPHAIETILSVVIANSEDASFAANPCRLICRDPNNLHHRQRRDNRRR